MDEDKQYPDSKHKSSREAGVFRRRRAEVLLGTVAVAVAVTLLLKYGPADKANIANPEDYSVDMGSVAQIAQELGIEDMMFYDGVIVLKPASQLRTSPKVVNVEQFVNDAGNSSNDSNNLTTLDKPLVAKDLENPENGYWVGYKQDGKTVWTSQQNVVEFDSKNIKHVDVQLPEEQ